MTRHPSAGLTRHEQITVFIYIIIASRRTPFIYYCQRQGHRAMIHGRAAKHPLHAGRAHAHADASTIHTRTLTCTRRQEAAGAAAAQSRESMTHSCLSHGDVSFSWADERSSPLCVCGGGACAKNVTFASSHQKKTHAKKHKGRFLSPEEHFRVLRQKHPERRLVFFSCLPAASAIG